MPAPRPAIVFDLDGTVWDSAPGVVSCIEATLEHYGLPIPPHEELLVHLGPPLLTMLADLGVPASHLDEARLLYRRRYSDHGEFECTVFDGIAELLDELRANGHALATATSKGVEAASRMLEHFDLAQRFDVTAAAAMTATGHGKPAIIGDALAGLAARGVDTATAVMVGDRRFDVEGGREHAMTTVGVSWGYAPAGELESAGADHIVDDVPALAALLLDGYPAALPRR